MRQNSNLWKLTLVLNVIILALFWLLAQIAITPIQNLLIQYAETQIALPILTGLAIQLQTPSVSILLLWAILTYAAERKMRDQEPEVRQDWLTAHTSMTLCIALGILCFFGLAAILPILKIGATL